MSRSSVAAADLELIVRGTGTREERRAAVLRAFQACWKDGWDACEEEYKAALTEAAVRFGPLQKEGRA